MNCDITNLYNFQVHYLFKLLENVPESRAYEKQLEGFNSAGWIVGHLCMEGIEVLEYFGVPIEYNSSWRGLFHNSAKPLQSLEGLPALKELKSDFLRIYGMLLEHFTSLSSTERSAGHPSQIIRQQLPNTSSWVGHHLTTHIGIHAGNLSVWKKLIGIAVNGY